MEVYRLQHICRWLFQRVIVVALSDLWTPVYNSLVQETLCTEIILCKWSCNKLFFSNKHIGHGEILHLHFLFFPGCFLGEGREGGCCT